MADVVLALTTVPADFDATALAQELVGTGLASCVTIIAGVRSVYVWQGVPQTEQEQQLVMKTVDDRIEALWDVLRDRHPYDMPEFLVLPVSGGSDDYLHWVERGIGPRTES
jgi:periplasmic divalent cation tolerance protein